MMNRKLRRIREGALLGMGSIMMVAAGSVAVAQTSAESDDERLEEIIITGSQIRGIEPIGSNLIGFDKDEIEASGQVDMNQVLGQLPQSNFFMDIPQPGGGVITQGTPRVPLERANLRNIPGTDTGSGSPTLVLLNGNRIVPAGLEQSVVDIGIFPTRMLERMEVMLDGASATYGSDAVAGVINMITRSRFDGTEISSRYGYADDYWQMDANLIHGFSWDTGGLSFSYEYAYNSDILRRQRGHQKPINWLLDPPAIDDLSCDRAHVENPLNPAGGIYSGADLTPGANPCAGNQYNTFIPSQERNSAFLVFSQDFTDALVLDVTAFYSKRTQKANAGPFLSTVTVPATNPYYQCIEAFGCGTPHRVHFSYGPVMGNDVEFSRTGTEIKQVTPTLTARLAHDWQLRTSLSYGQSNVSVDQNRLDATLQGRYAAGMSHVNAINPYDIAATENLALIDDLVWRNHQSAKQEFVQARLVGDGPLFSIPGGEVRAAVGVEWMDHTVTRRTTNQAPPFDRPPSQSVSTDSSALFAELVVPIVSETNARPGIERLTLSLSGRYDDYGEYGDTFNPKIAFSYQPVEWVTLRGNWGTSFRAPNAMDKLQANNSLLRCMGPAGMGIGCLPIPVAEPPADRRGDLPPSLAGHIHLFLTGTLADLEPEESDNWSIGFDISPPVIPGLTLSASYFEIDFDKFISTPQIGVSILPILENFPELTPILPSDEAIDALAALASGGPELIANIRANGYPIAYSVDARVRNLGGAKITGTDLSARYTRPTGFGSVDFVLNANVPIKNDFQYAAGMPISDELKYDVPDYTLTGTFGATIGDIRAQATVRHRDGVTPTPSINRLPSQTRLSSFTTVDLAFRWDVPAIGTLAENLVLSLNINNVFDEDPPLNKTTTGGTIENVSTIGRLIQVGFNKTF